jgi:uncharacterized membrane protein HdeD (DUF308 family)
MSGAAGPAGESPVGVDSGVIGRQIQESLKRGWKWLMFSGVLAIVGGFVAIAVPAIASVAVGIFIGWMLVFAGFFMLFGAISARGTGSHSVARGLWAVLCLIAGIYLLVAPLHGTFTLTVILAAWFFAIGIVRLLAWFRVRGTPGAGMVGVNGALSLILGLLIAVSLPSSADWAIGLLVGVDFLFYGFAAIMAASAGRQLAKGNGPPPAA